MTVLLPKKIPPCRPNKPGKFLQSQGFSYFSATARGKLMSQAESTANESFNSGFTLGSNKLLPTAFIY